MCFSAAGLWVMDDGLWVECILGWVLVWVCVRNAGAKIGKMHLKTILNFWVHYSGSVLQVC